MVAFAVAAPPAAIVAAGTAEAQLFKRKSEEAGEPEKRGFFQRLFGIRKKEEVPEQPAPRSTARRRTTEGGAAGAGVAAAPKPEPAVEKLENARVVLVVGDFLASGLGEGLNEAYAKSPGVRVVARANGSSGFVREDHFNWPGSIGAIIAEEKPAAVIVLMGANDRQQLVVDGTREKPFSDAWKSEYRTRVKTMADTVRQAGVPLLWMGAPSFKVTSMSTDMIALNDIYRDVAEQVGGEFIDVWDGFVDENGVFMPVGPDMNGQRVRLRGSDGINMTAAGKRKLAFYAEKPLNRLLGGAVAPAVAPALLDSAPIVMPLNPAEIDRTAPIALADPQLDGGVQLLGAKAGAPAKPADIPVAKLVREGITPPAAAGRADDFKTGGTTVLAAPAAATVEATGAIPLAASPETATTASN